MPTSVATLLACSLFATTSAEAIDSIVVFNEVHYHPLGNNHSIEFVELYNQNTVNVDLSQWRISGGIDFFFPEGTVINGGGYIVIASDPASIEAATGLSNVLGPYQGKLDNSGDTIRLRNNNDRIMDEMTYNDKAPWPIAADGSGATLSKTQPLTVSKLIRNWTASTQVLGTPGETNFPDEDAPPPTVLIPLLNFDANWRYNESGAGLGPDWAKQEHPETGNWKSGPGTHARENRLPVDIGTELIKPFLNDPYVITYYFETEFTLSDNQFNNAYALQLTHLIDDGAIFYLNGNELYRYNMPVGQVNSNTLASSGSEASVTDPIGIPMTGLRSGTNRLSVEVHQSNSGSSDVVMGLELDFLQTLPDPSAKPTLGLHEIAGASSEDWWFELKNSGPNPISLAGFRASINGDGNREYIFPEQALPAGKLLTIHASFSGLSPQDGDRLFLYSPNSFVLDAAIVDDDPRARISEHPSGPFYRPDQPTPDSPNVISFRDDVVINEIMYHHRPQYPSTGTPPTLETITILDFNSVWIYNETGNDLGVDWAQAPQLPFGDWLTGQGPLGFESNAARLPVPLGTWLKDPRDNDPRFFTYYFETQFNLNSEDIESIRELILTHMIDDGAVFYLNGIEVGRHNMPAGTISANTPAASGTEARLQSLAIDPVDLLLTGKNRISIELHQRSVGSSDIIMGLRLDARRATDNGDPGKPYTENSEQWVEIHNQSTTEIDISGWELDDAIRFTFPPNTSLPAKGYIVVSNDASTLSAKFPGSNVLGDFSGNLSHRSERIVLLDQKGNPADEVRYHDDKPWPRHADGGGSSLELRDPKADNAVPEAWADSSNSIQSEWVNYSYSMTAEMPTYTPSIGNFHELRLGLLDAGEVLIDDVSVIEDPGGNNRELMQNGSFDTGNANFWRMIGTHQLSEVVDGEDSPALKIVASTKMNYLNNLLESNLKSNGSLIPVRAGTEYQISFRAKWLKGSPQLRFELYYNRLAKTVILKQPTKHGTPGKNNSARETNIGPTFRDVRHFPAVPEVDQAITVSGQVDDPDGVNTVQLYYANDGSPFQNSPVVISADGTWSVQIPGQKSGRKIQFYIEASDGEAISFYPANGPESRAMIQVNDNRASEEIQNFRVIMSSRESSAMHNSAAILSNHRFGCTIITNERDIHYDCGVRLRGSMFSRNSSSETGINYKFPANKLFRGIHKTVTTRRRNIAEIITKHMVNHAGGIHDNYNDIVQLIHTTQVGPSRFSMARFGQPYLEGLPGGKGDKGTVFKMEGLRVFQSTVGGNPESPKLPFPIGWVSSFDLADQGDDKEMYRHNMRINSRLAEDRYDEIIAMCKAFSLRDQELEDEIRNVIDVDMWMRQFAIMSLLGIGDTYTQGNPHNLNFYVRPSDGKVEPMPWDWDFVFSQSTSAGLWGGRNFAKIPRRPVYGRIFHGHLVDLIETTFNTEYMNSWLAHYGSVAKQSYTGYSNTIRTRANFVLSRIPEKIPFSITTNDGDNFVIEGPTAELSGNGWVDVSQVLVEGSDLPLPILWSGSSSWKATVPLQPGRNTVTVKAFNRRGQEVGKDEIIIESTGNIGSANSANLALSELMYHPVTDDHEFVELVNLDTSNTIDLTGVRFSNGINYTFPDRTRLGPGARLVVTQSQFENNTRLSNNGERILLSDASGSIILNFQYGDSGAWPKSTDGNGFSLIRIDPDGERDPNLATEWRPSLELGGNPGTSDSQAFTGNTASELLVYAVPETSQMNAGFDKDGNLEITVRRNIAADDALIGLEASADGILWQSLANDTSIQLTNRTHHGDGTESLIFKTTANAAFDGAGAMILRTVVRLR